MMKKHQNGENSSDDSKIEALVMQVERLSGLESLGRSGVAAGLK